MHASAVHGTNGVPIERIIAEDRAADLRLAGMCLTLSPGRCMLAAILNRSYGCLRWMLAGGVAQSRSLLLLECGFGGWDVVHFTLEHCLADYFFAYATCRSGLCVSCMGCVVKQVCSSVFRSAPDPSDIVSSILDWVDELPGDPIVLDAGLCRDFCSINLYPVAARILENHTLDYALFAPSPETARGLAGCGVFLGTACLVGGCTSDHGKLEGAICPDHGEEIGAILTTWRGKDDIRMCRDTASIVLDMARIC